jgi:hypothetical protein
VFCIGIGSHRVAQTQAQARKGSRSGIDSFT